MHLQRQKIFALLIQCLLLASIALSEDILTLKSGNVVHAKISEYKNGVFRINNTDEAGKTNSWDSESIKNIDFGDSLTAIAKITFRSGKITRGNIWSYKDGLLRINKPGAGITYSRNINSIESIDFHSDHSELEFQTEKIEKERNSTEKSFNDLLLTEFKMHFATRSSTQWPDLNKTLLYSDRQEINYNHILVEITYAQLGTIHWKSRESKNPIIEIRLKISNLSKSKKVDYSTWQGNAVLTDDKGNHYRRVRIGFSPPYMPVEAGSQSLYPGEPTTDFLLFEKPVDLAEELELKLPAGNIVGSFMSNDDEIRFKISIRKENYKKATAIDIDKDGDMDIYAPVEGLGIWFENTTTVDTFIFRDFDGDGNLDARNIISGKTYYNTDSAK